MNIIHTLHIRTISSVIILSLMAVMIPKSASAADKQHDLFASLKPGQSFEGIPPAEFSRNEPEPATGRFLVATRRLNGSFFSGTVIFLLNHSEQGSTGMVVNRPSHVKLSTLFPEENIFQQSDDTIYSGGPVDLKNIFVLLLSASKPPESQHIIDNLYMTSSLETVKYLNDRTGTNENIRFLAGYAGWGSGQLTNEIARGSWHVITGDTKLIFDKNAEGLWERIIQRKIKK